MARGDCKQRTYRESPYCEYHEKLAAGLLEPFAAEWYPVFPLPPQGYVLPASTMKAVA